VKKEIKRFNVRVYGLLINSYNEILLSTERRGDFSFTKFPGGGLEFGEGAHDCLKREFVEELGVEIEIKSHFYTTDFFQTSTFSSEEQIISIYYLIAIPKTKEIKNGEKALDTAKGNLHFFHWHDIETLLENDLTFPIDRKVLELLKA